MIYDEDYVLKRPYWNVGLFDYWRAAKLPLYVLNAPTGETVEVNCKILYNPYTVSSSNMDFLFGTTFHSTLDSQQGVFRSNQGWIIPDRALSFYQRKFPQAHLISFSDATIRAALTKFKEDDRFYGQLNRSYISDYQKRTAEKRKFMDRLVNSNTTLIEEEIGQRNAYLTNVPFGAEMFERKVGSYTLYFRNVGSSLYHQYALTYIATEYSAKYAPLEIVFAELKSLDILAGGENYDLTDHQELMIYERIFRHCMRFQVYRLRVPEYVRVEKDPNWNAYTLTTGYYRIRFVMILKDQPQISEMDSDIGNFMSRIVEDNIAIKPGQYIEQEGSVAENFFYWKGEPNPNFPDNDVMDPF